LKSFLKSRQFSVEIFSDYSAKRELIQELVKIIKRLKSGEFKLVLWR